MIQNSAGPVTHGYDQGISKDCPKSSAQLRLRGDCQPPDLVLAPASAAVKYRVKVGLVFSPLGGPACGSFRGGGFRHDAGQQRIVCLLQGNRTRLCRGQPGESR